MATRRDCLTRIACLSVTLCLDGEVGQVNAQGVRISPAVAPPVNAVTLAGDGGAPFGLMLQGLGILQGFLGGSTDPLASLTQANLELQQIALNQLFSIQNTLADL